MWLAIAETAPLKLGQFKPQELANLAWACITVHSMLLPLSAQQAAMTRLVQVIARHSVDKIPSFKPQELCSLLRAVAKTGLQSEGALFDAAARHCIGLLRKQSEVLRNHAENVSHPTQAALSSPPRLALNSQDTANLLWAFAKAGCRNTPLLEALGDFVSLTADPLSPSDPPLSPELRLSFRPQELSIVLWSYATLQYNHVGVLQVAMKQLAHRSNQLSPQALANACWAAGRLARFRLDGVVGWGQFAMSMTKAATGSSKSLSGWWVGWLVG